MSDTFSMRNDFPAADDQDVWTIDRTAEEVFLCLAGIREEEALAENRQQYSTTTRIVHYRKYYHQARDLMKWIPIAKPPPVFIINISDLTPRIRKEIEATHPEDLNHIMTQAVGRIFENLDFKYYHLSIARNLRVRLEK